MTIQKRFKDKKRQEVWLAGMTGGTQHYLDELTPRGKVSLWKKIRTISIIILGDCYILAPKRLKN